MFSHIVCGWKVYSQNIEKPIIVFGLNGTFIIITGTKYKKVDEVGAGTDLYIDRRQWPYFFYFLYYYINSD